MKGYRAKLAKENVHAEKMRGNQEASFQGPLQELQPVPLQHRTAISYGYGSPGKPTRDSGPQVLIGVDHIGTLYLTCTKLATPEGKQCSP